MKLMASPDGKHLLVVKDIEEEISDCSDEKIKEKLQEFNEKFKELKQQEEAMNQLIQPLEKLLGDKLKEFNSDKEGE